MKTFHAIKASSRRQICLGFLLVLILSGCSGVRVCEKECPALSPGCYVAPRNCCCLEKDPNLISKVRSHGIQIERMGDQVLLVLPSDKFFYGRSSRLNPETYFDLVDLITFINCFKKIEVKIVAYTDCAGCVDEDLALTKTQATNLASYLWLHGLDARLVYPTGYGKFCPIANNWTTRGAHKNRRIEITLTHLPLGVYDE
jgi:outer membrane protein OmpA-like peptidoglycan-associated protein